MAKKPNPQRKARAAQKDQRMNRATALVSVGFLAEIYFLLFYRLFANGSIDQVVACAEYLEVMRFLGLAIALAGGVLLFLRKKKEPLFARLGAALLACGLILSLSSFLMLAVFPGGTTAMCVFIPVATILGIVGLLYPAEFFVEAIALSGSIAALYLLGRGLDKPSWSTLVRVLAVLAILVLAACAFVSFRLQKQGGALRAGGKKLLADSANYRLFYAVLALCAAAILIGLFAAGAAFYGIWALAVALFALAVYYTVKMM